VNIVAIIAFISGAGLVAWAVYWSVRGGKSRWHQVNTRSRSVEVQRDTTGQYTATVFYTYIVEVRKYSGKYQLQRLVSSEIEAHHQVQAEFPKDRELTVYYNPQKPEESTLAVPKSPSFVMASGVIGVLLMIVATGLSYF
jgi:hypothetical protein